MQQSVHGLLLLLATSLLPSCASADSEADGRLRKRAEQAVGEGVGGMFTRDHMGLKAFRETESFVRGNGKLCNTIVAERFLGARFNAEAASSLCIAGFLRLTSASDPGGSLANTPVSGDCRRCPPCRGIFAWRNRWMECR